MVSLSLFDKWCISSKKVKKLQQKKKNHKEIANSFTKLQNQTIYYSEVDKFWSDSQIDVNLEVVYGEFMLFILFSFNHVS